MRWLVAEAAEVIRCGHQPRTEDPLPDAVHIDARGERMLRIEKRLRKFQTSAALAGSDMVPAAEDPQKIRLHEFPGRIHVATHVERIGGFRDLRLIHAVHGAWERGTGFDPAVIGEQRGEMRLGLRYVR